MARSNFFLFRFSASRHISNAYCCLKLLFLQLLEAILECCHLAEVPEYQWFWWHTREGVGTAIKRRISGKLLFAANWFPRNCHQQFVSSVHCLIQSATRKVVLMMIDAETINFANVIRVEKLIHLESFGKLFSYLFGSKNEKLLHFSPSLRWVINY